MDAGENINDAVAREVLEETGLKAEFHRVLCVRHSHGEEMCGMFKRSRDPDSHQKTLEY